MNLKFPFILALLLTGCDRNHPNSDSANGNTEPTPKKYSDRSSEKSDTVSTTNYVPVDGSPMVSFEAFLAKIEAEKDPARRLEMFSQLLFSEGANRSAELQEAIDRLFDEPDRTILKQRLGYHSVQSNPDLFYNSLRNTVPGLERRRLLVVAVSRMTPAQLKELMIHLEENGYPEDGDLLFSAIASPSTRSNIRTLDDLNQIAGAVNDTKIRNALVSAYAFSIEVTSFTAYDQLTVGLPRDLQLRFAELIYQKLLHKSPDQLDDILLDPSTPSELGHQLMREQIDLQVGKSFNETVSFAATFNEPIATEFLSGSAAQWIRQNSLAASQAAGKMDPGRPRDILSKEIAIYAALSDEWQSAYSWTEQIADTTLKEQALKKLGSLHEHKQKGN